MTNSSSREGKFSDLLAELKADYRKGFPAKVQLLSELMQKQEWALLKEEFHKLKGTGKTYGYPEVSILCEALETYCGHQPINPQKLKIIFPVFQRMLEAWEKGDHFHWQQDPEAHMILALKGDTA